MDASLQKSFCKGKLKATLAWNDIFKSDDMNTYTTLNSRYIRYHYYMDQSYVQLSLSYHFGFDGKKRTSHSAIDTETSRIKGF